MWVVGYLLFLQGAEGEEYKVGVSPNGIVIYRGKHRVGLYHWPRIDVINFKGKQIILQVRDKFVSLLSERSNCLALWVGCQKARPWLLL